MASVLREVSGRINALSTRIRGQERAAALDRPRHIRTALTAIATGQTVVAISWAVPVPDTYVVVSMMIGANGNVGLLTAAQVAGSQTPVGCDIVVSNRTGGQVAAAVLDVLVHPT